MYKRKTIVVLCVATIAAFTACTKPRPKPDAATQATEQTQEQRIQELTERLAKAERRADDLAAKLAKTEDREKAVTKKVADAVEKAATAMRTPKNSDLPVGERMIRVWDYNAQMARTVRIDTIEWACETDKNGKRIAFHRQGTKFGPKKEFVFGVEVRDEQSEAWVREYLGLKPL
jgi:hypothetical protein